jgi:DivIVA domain-containing protein
MDASQSALDSLRTVEFRETLKGYHRDDVDEYLEKAAVEAEGLQEQLRQSGERLRQAAERISQLETQLEAVAEQQPAPQRVEAPVVADDTLQRTLLLAQKFVDETKADSEAQAARVVAEAEAKAREVTESAQSRASLIAAESEQRLREEIARLEESRIRLTGQVESMSNHLESERNRLRTALGDILRWVDQNVQPSPSSPDGSRPEPAPVDTGESTGSGATPASATVIQGGNRPTTSPPVAPAPASSGTGPTGEVTQVRPSGGMTRPASSNAPLPL